jgi:hypothetical protein
MSVDWKKLAPHKPLDAGSAGYSPPPHSASERIAQWVIASQGTVLVGGPVGIGKSTELAHTSLLLQQERLPVLIQLDRLANMQTLSPERAKQLLVQQLTAAYPGVLSPHLLKSLQSALETSPFAMLADAAHGDDLLLAAINEASRLKRVCFLVDGIEKSPEPVARELFKVFSWVSNYADLVVVVPWYAAFGPGANQVIQAGEKFFSVRAVPLDTDVGRAFFRLLLARRLELTESQLAEHEAIVDRAAELSGGSPRTFLQLLADAAAYARIRGHGDWPASEDLDSAFRDQIDTIRRILLPGDKQVLANADKTDGTEIELGTRIRLLSHGLLLEQEEGGKALLRMPPMVATLIAGG